MSFDTFEYKAGSFGAGSNGRFTSNLDEAQGIVECFVAGIGNKDSVGDIVASGAFTKSLQRRKPRVVWGHNWNDPIGKVLEIYEVPSTDPRLPMKMKMAGIGGLFARVQFNLQSEKGREAFANVAFFGEEQEWSIGYKTLKAQFDQKSQANVIYELELYEVSPVLHGANQLTGTISVKADDPYASEDSGMVAIMPEKEDIEKQLSEILGTKVSLMDMSDDSLVFARRKPDGEVARFKCSWMRSGGRLMFGAPEMIMPPKPRVIVQPMPMAGPAMPGMVPANEPQRVVRPSQMPSIPVAIKPSENGVIAVPLPMVQYEGQDAAVDKNNLSKEEADLRDALLKIVKRHGKFNEDSEGVWAGYKPAAKNPVAGIGVKCANCVMYEGGDSCKIIDMKVEPEGKCRFAVIPDGVVKGDAITKKNYELDSDEKALEYIEDLEEKYPGEFILGILRGAVGKRKKKRRKYKDLSEFDGSEDHLGEKSYCIPVLPQHAFSVKQALDPIFDFYMADTFVDVDGIVIKSGLSIEMIDAIDTAMENLKKKFLNSDDVEQKALGRRLSGYLASRAIDRPRLGRGRGDRRVRDVNFTTPGARDFNPATAPDRDLDGEVGDEEYMRGIPLAQPDPTPYGPNSIYSGREEKPGQTVSRKLTSGMDLGRHGYGKANEQKFKPSIEEREARIAHDQIASRWVRDGFGWEPSPRSDKDRKLSSEFLRGREMGKNQARLIGLERNKPTNRSSEEYEDWFYDAVMKSGKYLMAARQFSNTKDRRRDEDYYDGIDDGIRSSITGLMPSIPESEKEKKNTIAAWINANGLGSDSKKRSKSRLSSGKLPGLDDDFDPDNPYGEDNLPFDQTGEETYNRIINDFLGQEQPRPKVTTKKPSPKAIEDYTDEDIYRERSSGASLSEMAEKLGVSRADVRRAEQRHLAKLREKERAESSMAKLSSGYAEYIKTDPDKRSREDQLKYDGPLAGLRDGQRLSSGATDVKDESIPEDAPEVKDVFEKIAQQFIAALEEIAKNPNAKKSWEFPWRSADIYARNPTNRQGGIDTGRIYQGMNQLILQFTSSSRGYSVNRWAGEKQWKELGKAGRGKKNPVKIKDGRENRGVNILAPIFKDPYGNPYPYPLFKAVTVYNAEDMEGLPEEMYEPLKFDELDEGQRLKDAEDVIKEIGPDYTEVGFRAFYSPSQDIIKIPPFASFKEPIGFYATLLHEIVHWTGHPSRMDRDQTGSRAFPGTKGYRNYAFEELVAEIGSAMIMGALGLEPEVRDDHIAYVDGWLDAIRNDPTAIRRAIEKSQQAVDYVMNKSTTLRRLSGIPDDERKGKQDVMVEVPMLAGFEDSPKVRPVTGGIRGTFEMPEIEDIDPDDIPGSAERLSSGRRYSGITGFKIQDAQGNRYDQLNRRLSSGRGEIQHISGDPAKAIKRTEGSFQDKYGFAFEPTEQQKDIIDAVRHLVETRSPGLIAVRAAAGSGKTTTSELSVSAMLQDFPDKTFYYITFNKKNQIEGEKRMPNNTGVSTINSLAYNSIILDSSGKFSEGLKAKVAISTRAKSTFYGKDTDNFKKKKSEVGYKGKTYDVTGRRIVGYTDLGYVAYDKDDYKELKELINLDQEFPDGVDHEGTELTVDEMSLVLLAALNRFTESSDDKLTSEHFKLRQNEIESNEFQISKGDSPPPENTQFENIPSKWVDLATKMWENVINPDTNVVPTYNQQVKIWALSNPDLKTDPGMISHAKANHMPGRSQDSTLTIGEIVTVKGEEYVKAKGKGKDKKGKLKKKFGTAQKPISAFFFDEAQDVNPVLEKVLRDNVQNGLSLIMVGDPRQSIYQFRGATDLFEKLVPDYNLALTESFRFGKTVGYMANLVLGRGNITDRENGATDEATKYQVVGELQSVVAADLNLGSLKGEDLSRKLEKISKKYKLYGANNETLDKIPEDEARKIVSEAAGYLTAEAEGVIVSQMPMNVDGTFAVISQTNKNSIIQGLEISMMHPEKIIGLPEKKYDELEEFLNHFLWVITPPGRRLGSQPPKSKIIGNAWTLEEINRRAKNQAQFGQLASMMRLMQTKGPSGKQMNAVEIKQMLTGVKDPETGNYTVLPKIRPIAEPLAVGPFKNPSGTSYEVSDVDLVSISKRTGKGKGGRGKTGDKKEGIAENFYIIPPQEGQNYKDIFWTMDLNEKGSWSGGVVITGEGMQGVYEYTDNGKKKTTGEKGMTSKSRRRIEALAEKLNLGDKVQIKKQGYDDRRSDAKRPALDALVIKGSDDRETAQLLTLFGKMIAETANDPEVDVSLLTAHDSKGLEFDNVILGNDYFQPEFDSAGNMLKDISRQTENLIYVALTRAKKRMQLSESVSWLFDRKKNPKGFQFVENELPENLQKPTGFWNPFEAGAQPKAPDGSREGVAGTLSSGMDQAAIPGSRTNRRARRAARGGDESAEGQSAGRISQIPAEMARVQQSPSRGRRASRRESRLASGMAVPNGINAMTLASLRGGNNETREFAMNFWNGFRKRGITLDTSSTSINAAERKRLINAGLEKTSRRMAQRPEVQVGSVSNNRKLQNPGPDNWMLPVSALRDTIRIPTEYDVRRSSTDNSVTDVSWTKSEPISNAQLAKLLSLNPEQAARLSDEDAGISHDAVRYLIAELGNQPEFSGWRLFSPVTPDEPGFERISTREAFSENLGRANMRDRFIIETFGKDAFPFWYERDEDQVIPSEEYAALGEVDPVAKFNASGRFVNDKDAGDSSFAELDLMEEGMPNTRAREVVQDLVAEQSASSTKTKKSDFPADELINSLGLANNADWYRELRQMMQESFGMEDVGLAGPREARSWERDGVPVAYIREMIRTGMIPDAKSVWKKNESGSKLDEELAAVKHNVYEAMFDFLAKTQAGSKENNKKNRQFIFNATDLGTLIPGVLKKRGAIFSKNKGDEPRYSRGELQDMVNRFNKIFGTNHEIEDIFSREQLEAARDRIERDGKTSMPRKKKTEQANEQA